MSASESAAIINGFYFFIIHEHCESSIRPLAAYIYLAVTDVN